MAISTSIIIFIFVIGILLAFPLAILVCVAIGFMLKFVDRITTRCPHCHERKMTQVNAIKESYPTGKGTGSFYTCERCNRRWFWSNDTKQFEDATDPSFNQWYKK